MYEKNSDSELAFSINDSDEIIGVITILTTSLNRWFFISMSAMVGKIKYPLDSRHGSGSLTKQNTIDVINDLLNHTYTILVGEILKHIDILCIHIYMGFKRKI